MSINENQLQILKEGITIFSKFGEHNKLPANLFLENYFSSRQVLYPHVFSNIFANNITYNLEEKIKDEEDENKKLEWKSVLVNWHSRKAIVQNTGTEVATTEQVKKMFDEAKKEVQKFLPDHLPTTQFLQRLAKEKDFKWNEEIEKKIQTIRNTFNKRKSRKSNKKEFKTKDKGDKEEIQESEGEDKDEKKEDFGENLFESFPSNSSSKITCYTRKKRAINNIDNNNHSLLFGNEFTPRKSLIENEPDSSSSQGSQRTTSPYNSEE